MASVYRYGVGRRFGQTGERCGAFLPPSKTRTRPIGSRPFSKRRWTTYERKTIPGHSTTAGVTEIEAAVESRWTSGRLLWDRSSRRRSRMPLRTEFVSIRRVMGVDGDLRQLYVGGSTRLTVELGLLSSSSPPHPTHPLPTSPTPSELSSSTGATKTRHRTEAQGRGEHSVVTNGERRSTRRPVKSRR